MAVGKIKTHWAVICKACGYEFYLPEKPLGMAVCPRCGKARFPRQCREEPIPKKKRGKK